MTARVPGPRSPAGWREVRCSPGNWRSGLKVSETQKRFVSDDMGMALYYDCDERKAFDLSQIFIDERYQGKGFGTEATRQILKRMESDGKYDKVILCYIDGNEAAKNMYEKLGFHFTGERDEDEIIMEKSLR